MLRAGDRSIIVSMAIHTVGLGKRYGDTVALEGLNLTINEGEVYGYLGPNGAGKTTTIRLLLGLHRPSAGSAELFGVDAWRDPVCAHSRVAYVAGEPSLWPSLTSAETFEFLARLSGGTDVAYRDVLIERFQLDANKKIRALSKGNRQKVQLIAAFASRAYLLLLDEPTAGLDPLMEVAFRETVVEAKRRGQAIFLSSHILSEVEALCDRVGILRAGRLVDEGTLNNVLVGVDGRPNDRDAVALAARFTDTTGTLTLTLAHVHGGELNPSHAISPGLVREEREASAKLLEDERAVAEVDAELVSVVATSPGRGLHQQVEDQGADLLVVGSCSHGAFGRAMLGDDTRAALNGAPCAVAVATLGFAIRD